VRDIRLSPHVSAILPIVGNSPYADNIVPAYCYGSKLNTLIDSGASISAISDNKLKSILRGRHIDIRSPVCPFIRIANGQEIRVIGETSFPISIGGTKTQVYVVILPTLSQDLILGRDFLIKSKVILDYNKGVMHFGNNIPVYTSNTVIIPPKSEVLCRA
jgi:hypothetical protein